MKTGLVLASSLLLLPLTAGGQETSLLDYELAQEAVDRGEILPLAEILANLASTHPGRVIEVELEYSDDQRIYEVELVTEDGRLIEVELDAVTGAIIDVEDDDD